MPRHFYLHHPQPPFLHFPTVCVATADPFQIHNEDSTYTKINYAVATYNLADIGKLAYDKSEARNKALGRLKSNRHFLTLIIPEQPEGQPLSVKRLICESIAFGEWFTAHPGAIYAHAAARHWLQTHVVPRQQDITHVQVVALNQLSQEAQAAALSGDEQPEPPAPVPIELAPDDEFVEIVPTTEEIDKDDIEEMIDHELDRMADEGGISHEVPPPTPTPPEPLIFIHTQFVANNPSPEKLDELQAQVEEDAILNRVFGPEHPRWP